MKDQLIFEDQQYDIYTSLDVNGFEHAKNFLEIAFGSLKDFAGQQGLSKEEVAARVQVLKDKVSELEADIKSL